MKKLGKKAINNMAKQAIISSIRQDIFDNVIEETVQEYGEFTMSDNEKVKVIKAVKKAAMLILSY